MTSSKRFLHKCLTPSQKTNSFINLDILVPLPAQLLADEWVDILKDAKNVFEVDGAAVVFSSWRVEDEEPLDIDDIETVDGMYVRAGRQTLDSRMTDQRAAQLRTALPDGEFRPETQAPA